MGAGASIEKDFYTEEEIKVIVGEGNFDIELFNLKKNEEGMASKVDLEEVIKALEEVIKAQNMKKSKMIDEVLNLADLEQELPKFKKDTMVVLEQSTGFLNIKNKVEEMAMEVLPEDYMDKYASVKPEILRQVGCESIDDVYAKATEVLPVFTPIMEEIVQSAGLDPESEPTCDGKPLVLIPATETSPAKYFKTLTVAPLKGRERAMEKIRDDYDGDAARLVDIVRCSVVVETEEALDKVTGSLQEAGMIVRLKNRFKKPLWNGYRDALFTVKIFGFLCEVQLHLAFILKFKEESHVYYAFFRTFFAGNVDACEERVQLLETIFSGDKENESETVEMKLKRRLHRDEYSSDDAYVDVLIAVKKLGQVLGDWELQLCAVLAMVKFYKKGGKAEEESLLTQMNNLGLCYDELGKKEQALPIYEVTLKMSKKILGEEDKETLTSMNNLAVCYENMGKLDQALPLKEETLKIQKRVLGEEHPSTLTSMGNLALAYKKVGKQAEAIDLYETTLKIKKKVLGDTHPDTLESMVSLGGTYMQMGLFMDKGLDLIQSAVKGYKTTLGETHPDTQWAISALNHFKNN